MLTEFKGETDNSTIIVGHFNSPLSTKDKQPDERSINKKQPWTTSPASEPNKHI